MPREWLWPLAVVSVVAGCYLLLVTNQQQFAEQMRELRAEVAVLRGTPSTPTLLPALPPEDPASQVSAGGMPNPTAAEIEDFGKIFRQNLEAQLVSENQTDETRDMIREALRGPRNPSPR